MKTEEYWTYSKNEDYNKALAIAKEQVSFGERGFPESMFLAESYYRLGYVYMDMKDYGNAEHYFQLALSMYKTKGITTAHTHKVLARIYRESGRKDSALVAINRALQEYTALPDIDSTDFYEAKSILCDLSIINLEYEKATGLIDEIHRFGESSGDSSLIVDAVSSRVLLNLYLGKLDSTTENALFAANYFSRNNKKEGYGNGLSLLAATYVMKKDYESAISIFKKAAEFKISHFKDSSFIKLELKNLASVYKLKGDFENSNKYYSLYNEQK